MGAILTLKRPLNTLLDLEPLSAFAEGGADGIERAPLRMGGRLVRTGELFERDETADGGLTLRGELRLCVHIGAGMRNGSIRAESSVGAGAGARMEGGELEILGDAGKGACRNMQNGFVRIRGGAESGLAENMRRGIVVLEGRAEGTVGEKMHGGTVLLLGGAAAAEQIGRSLSRGTIILPNGAEIPGGFARTASGDYAFLRLLFLELLEKGVPIPNGWVGGAFTRFRGDAAGLGKGEVFAFAGETAL